MIRYSLVLLLTSFFFTVHAQTGNPSGAQSKLIHPEDLMSLFPEETGNYKFSQISNPPIHSIPPKIMVINALYVVDREKSLFLQMIHYRKPVYRFEQSYRNWEAGLRTKESIERTYKGHTAYQKEDSPKISVYIGDAFEVVTYSSSGEATLDDLNKALDAVNFTQLEKLIKQYYAGNDDSKSIKNSKEKQSSTTENVKYATIKCDTFNSAFKEKIKKELNIQKIAPWTHMLEGKQSATAKIEDNLLVFPKKGNDWLQCVKLNDIIWSPWDMPMFIRRIKEINEESDSMVLKTENADLNEVMLESKSNKTEKKD
jgi:hypothetical protein